MLGNRLPQAGEGDGKPVRQQKAVLRYRAIGAAFYASGAAHC